MKIIDKLRNLPSTHQILSDSNLSLLIREYGILIVTQSVKTVLSESRDKIKHNNTVTYDNLLKSIKNKILNTMQSSLRPVINLTGTVLHTNLGRAQLPKTAIQAMVDVARGPSSLEYDLDKGKRGDRHKHTEALICRLTGAQAAVVVNNNAAALLLIINSLSENAEVICSRGQIVEIGGSFRISEIIKKGGGILKEVGSTNRTHLEDYEKEISKNTKLLLWVHTSNYIMKGYTKEVPLEDIVSIGKKYKIPVVADLGSGSFIDMSKFGIPSEIPVSEIVKKGPDITLFSGDKMLGGPQSGIILSTKILINIIKSNSIYRTVRCDKITIAILDDILRSYKKNGFLKSNLALMLLTQNRKILKKMAEKIINSVQEYKLRTLGLTIENSMVEAGSGSLPEKNLKSVTLKFSPKDMSLSLIHI